MGIWNVVESLAALGTFGVAVIYVESNKRDPRLRLHIDVRRRVSHFYQQLGFLADEDTEIRDLMFSIWMPGDLRILLRHRHSAALVTKPAGPSKVIQRGSATAAKELETCVMIRCLSCPKISSAFFVLLSAVPAVFLESAQHQLVVHGRNARMNCVAR